MNLKIQNKNRLHSLLPQFVESWAWIIQLSEFPFSEQIHKKHAA